MKREPWWVVVVPAVVVPAIAAVSVGWQWSVRDQLPERIVAHWDFAGRPNGWTTPTVHAWTSAALIVVVPGILLVVGAVSRACVRWRGWRAGWPPSWAHS